MFYFSRLVSDLLCPDEYVVILCYSHMYLIHQRQSDVVSCKYAACIDLVMKRMVPRGWKTDVLAKNRVITKVNSSF